MVLPIDDFLNLPPLRSPRKVKPKKLPVPAHVKQRYYDAHKQAFNPVAKASGYYYQCAFPDTYTANGLTQAIVKFLMWSGHRATRVASSGRIVKAPERQASGTVLQTAKYIPGTTRKGTADISVTIKGRAVMLEIKVGNDRPSEYQLREQDIERRAGGVYEFIHSFEEFIVWYDGFILSLSGQM